MSDEDNSDSAYGGSIASGGQHRCAELYVAAPAYATRKEAHLYHIGTRNYFAYLMHAPLVGESLGLALAELWRRILCWQPADKAILAFKPYCQEQGYLNYAENPDYALASLYFAEQTKSRDFWVDAFVHCVGMYDRLDCSGEMAKVSSKTMLLLDRAATELDAYVARVARSLGTFLEDDLGPENLGLSKPLRDHLDRFRSTLHCFYVHHINGLFPPPPGTPWNKRLWHDMCRDFQCLYDYLADTQSSDDRANNRGLHGGVCIAQNLEAFDKRHALVPLPHPLPLLPELQTPQQIRAERRMSLGSLLSRSGPMLGPARTPRQALQNASNALKPEVFSNRLVQEYIRFENLKMLEKTTIIEARKVRWLLVYSVLQMLISLTKAPADVRNPTDSSYPLCVQDTALPSWMEESVAWQAHKRTATDDLTKTEIESFPKIMEDDHISIHPDCEAENADQYFSMTAFSRTAFSRTGSEMSMASMAPLTHRRTSTLSRTASIRSSVNSIHRSVVGSLSRRNSQRRPSLILQRPTFSSDRPIETIGRPNDDLFCESPSSDHSNEEDRKSQFVYQDLQAEPYKFPGGDIPSWLPASEERQVNHERPRTQHSPSKHTPIRLGQAKWLKSSPNLARSFAKHLSSPPSRPECVSGPTEIDESPLNFSRRGRHSIITKYPPPTYQVKWVETTKPHESTRANSINAGCYVPTRPPPSRTWSKESVCSSNSSASVYPDASVQAAEIEEREIRGRGRLRVFRKWPVLGIVS
jgi:hypothetical protein